MSGKKLNYDKFCWVCCVEGTNQNCWSCVRTFHIECTNENITSDKWLCPVCVSIKAATIADEQRGLELLPLIMKRVYDNPSYGVLKSPHHVNSAKVVINRVIVRPMNLTILMENISTYRNFEQFLADVEWMVHNCMILHAKLHLITRTARVLLEYLIREIDIVKMCTDCYRNANVREMGWFTRVCRKPHLIVWTKRCDNNYWPAKVMSTNGEEVMVQFFGNHTKANVSTTASCFLYSDENPRHLNVPSYLYRSALRETNQYIENVCKKFGTYNLCANGTVFDPTMTDIDVYLAEAIPEFDGFDQASNASVDVDERENIKVPANNIDDRRDKPEASEKIGKNKVVSENVLETAAKRIRLNNSYVDSSTTANEHANRQTVIEPLRKRIENVKNIEPCTSSSIQNNMVSGKESDSLDGISSNIAAELMKKLASTEDILKTLVNQRLEAVLSDERANHKRQLDAMKHELHEAKSELQKANAEKLELQQIADRKIVQLKKRDRQLAQAHLDYNDLMDEFHNAKNLCDACGKKNTRISR